MGQKAQLPILRSLKQLRQQHLLMLSLCSQRRSWIIWLLRCLRSELSSQRLFLKQYILRALSIPTSRRYSMVWVKISSSSLIVPI
ncbi:unnamed protein product [Hymenolepis diminuta]|uniref:Uncharacterized protein n=1 Tax=Hymenolepis diminuta TaxID=6216 RepID=A0A3P6ZE31_HYMDI|nr:unnamed protein product [Hymenolepis diminuta]